MAFFPLWFWQGLVAVALVAVAVSIITLVVLFVVDHKRGELW